MWLASLHTEALGQCVCVYIVVQHMYLLSTKKLHELHECGTLTYRCINLQLHNMTDHMDLINFKRVIVLSLVKVKHTEFFSAR